MTPDLRDRVPVEPLDADTVDRIERRVLYAYEGVETAPVSPPAWKTAARWLVPAVAVAGVALAIALNLRGAAEPQRRTIHVGPGSEVALRHADGDTIYEIDGATIRLAAGTDARVRRDDHGLTVDLEVGRVDCEVEPRPARSPFVVRAGEVDVVVVGTVFGVERDPDGAVRVDVTRGVVRVEDGGDSHELLAGQRWTGDAVETAAALPGPGEDDGPDPTPADPGAAEVAVAPDREPRTGRTPAPRPSPGEDRPRNAGDDTPAALPRPAAPQAAFDDVSDAELDAIMALETGDPREAARQYRAYALAHDGRPAARALYSETFVRYYRLGDRAGALQAMRLYERRFPTEARTESALWLRVTILCDGELDRTCRAAAHTYVGRFPAGAWADDANRVINESM